MLKRLSAPLLATAAVTAAVLSGASAPARPTPPPPALPAAHQVAGVPATFPELTELERAHGADVDAVISRIVEQAEHAHATNGEFELDDAEPLIDDFGTAELVDFVRIASSEGLSIPETLRRYHAQQDFNEAADEFAEKYPDQYAGHEVNLPGSAAWFAFAGEVPADVLERLALVPAPSTVQGGYAHSMKTLGEVSVTLTEDLPVATGAGPLIHENAIAYEVPADDARSDAAVERARTIAARSGIELRVERVEDARVEAHDSNARGGAWIIEYSTWSPGDPWGCTAGFVMRYNGGYAMSTAGHCQTYGSLWKMHLLPVDGSTYTWVANLGSRWRNANGDGGLLTLGNFRPMDSFYYKWNYKRSVNKVSYWPGDNTQICAYGRVSGGHCAKIVNQNWSSDGLGDQLRMGSSPMTGGDSGGPWFIGDAAAGTYTGSTALGRRDLATSMRGFRDQVGAVPYIKP